MRGVSSWEPFLLIGSGPREKNPGPPKEIPMNDDFSPLAPVTEIASPRVAQPPASEKKKRGFAAMNPDQVRELARRGGVAAHRAGTAHEFTSDEARAAGRKGGLASHTLPSQASSTRNGAALEG
jgi:general stress protein YciG